jgi:hypothetical protein
VLIDSRMNSTTVQFQMDSLSAIGATLLLVYVLNTYSSVRLLTICVIDPRKAVRLVLRPIPKQKSHGKLLRRYAAAMKLVMCRFDS